MAAMFVDIGDNKKEALLLQSCRTFVTKFE